MTVVIGGIGKLIETAVAAGDIPSGAFAVVHQGRILGQEAFGWADGEKRVPATPQTPYRLASVTKALTGLAVMILAERATLALDRPANDYLGSAPLRAHVGQAADATIRRLANHTAGLTTHYQRFPLNGAPDRPPMEETIRRYGHLVHPPGERFDYSNLGYGILGHVVSRLAARPFAHVLGEEIFAPLGMAQAALADQAPLPDGLAVPYGPDGVRVAETCCDHVGASSAAASVADLARLALFLLGTPLPDQQAILSPAGVAELLRPTTAAWGDDGYGIGWRIWSDGAGHVHASAQGGTTTASALLDLVPGAAFGVAAVTNTGSEVPQAVAERATAAVLPAVGLPAGGRPAAGEGDARDLPAGTSSVTLRRPDPEVVGTWRGAIDTYQGSRRLDLAVASGGNVTARLHGAEDAALGDVTFQPGRISGQFPGDLRTTDTSRHPGVIELVLTRRGRSLSGAATALSPWSGLSHWVELGPA